VRLVDRETQGVDSFDRVKHVGRNNRLFRTRMK